MNSTDVEASEVTETDLLSQDDELWHYAVTCTACTPNSYIGQYQVMLCGVVDVIEDIVDYPRNVNCRNCLACWRARMLRCALCGKDL